MEEGDGTGRRGPDHASGARSPVLGTDDRRGRPRLLSAGWDTVRHSLLGPWRLARLTMDAPAPTRAPANRVWAVARLRAGGVAGRLRPAGSAAGAVRAAGRAPLPWRPTAPRQLRDQRLASD